MPHFMTTKFKGAGGLPPAAIACLIVAACLCFAPCRARSGAAPPLPRRALLTSDFLLAEWSGGLLANAAFMPGADAGPPHEAFLGTLALRETLMTLKPRPPATVEVRGQNVALFPSVKLAFFSDAGDLVPFTQDVIRGGTDGARQSYWDIIVQPGREWSEPGDGEWSRAAFPFALVNSLEGETHNGIASFLYKAGRVSNLRFQIVQQTSPFYVKQAFFAAGLVPATLLAVPPRRVADPDIAALSKIYEQSLAGAVHIADWSTLASKVGADRLGGFDGRTPVRDIVLAGLDFGGTFYLEECLSAGGPLPWCDRARFGVWSATKALANETALLRLAQKFGPSVFEAKIADFVPQAAQHPGWEGVRFEDAIDMATGIGAGSTKIDPNDISDGYLTDTSYDAWYSASSVQAKLKIMFDAGGVYPWGPGKVARYRDQDMFVLGVAMDKFLKSKEGPAADLWSMLQHEVFEPIGIYYAPTNRTLETDGSPGQPLMAYGYYPTIGDMVKIARLYQSGGKFGDVQILYAPRIASLLAGPEPHGLPTGEHFAFGEVRYTNAFWVAPYRSGACEVYYPRMIGWGGNVVALLPGGTVGIRIAKSSGDAGDAFSNTDGMAEVAQRLTHFCNPPSKAQGAAASVEVSR